MILIIKDKGPGIPKESLEAVFEPYVRVAKDDEGHGLVLGIARNIIHAHGGDMAIHNAVDGGLEVKVYIPRLLKED